MSSLSFLVPKLKVGCPEDGGAPKAIFDAPNWNAPGEGTPDVFANELPNAGAGAGAGVDVVVDVAEPKEKRCGVVAASLSPSLSLGLEGEPNPKVGALDPDPPNEKPLAAEVVVDLEPKPKVGADVAVDVEAGAGAGAFFSASLGLPLDESSLPFAPLDVVLAPTGLPLNEKPPDGRENLGAPGIESVASALLSSSAPVFPRVADTGLPPNEKPPLGSVNEGALVEVDDSFPVLSFDSLVAEALAGAGAELGSDVLGGAEEAAGLLVPKEKAGVLAGAAEVDFDSVFSAAGAVVLADLRSSSILDLKREYCASTSLSSVE